MDSLDSQESPDVFYLFHDLRKFLRVILSCNEEIVLANFHFDMFTHCASLCDILFFLSLDFGFWVL